MSYYTVSLSTQARDLHSTQNTIDRIGIQAASKYPASHNRKRYYAEQTAKIEYCKKKATQIYGYRIGDTIAYIESVNLGTKKYPEIVPSVDYGVITKINQQSVSTESRRAISYGKILGKVTAKRATIVNTQYGLMATTLPPKKWSEGWKAVQENEPKKKASNTNGFGLPAPKKNGWPNVK